MKLFKCSTQMTLNIVELPRHNWRVMPPSKLTVIATLAGVVITSILWAVF